MSVMNSKRIESYSLILESTIQNQGYSDLDQVASVVDRLVEQVILNNDFEKQIARCQEFIQQARNQRKETKKLLDISSENYFVKKYLTNSNEFTFEERIARGQKLIERAQIQTQEYSDLDQVASVVDDLIEQVILNDDFEKQIARCQEFLQQARNRRKETKKILDISSENSFVKKYLTNSNEFTSEERIARCQKLIEYAHDTNIRTCKILGITSKRVFADLNELTPEEHEVRRKEGFQQLHDKNIKTCRQSNQEPYQGDVIWDASAQTPDRHSGINKKIVQRAFLGGLSAGGVAAIIFAFILTPVWVLFISIASISVGAISGALVAKYEK